MPRLEQLIETHMSKLPESRRRQRWPAWPLARGKIRLGDRELLNFAGNDYLGLCHDPRLKRASSKMLDGAAGSGASPLVTGYHPQAQLIEKRLAALKGSAAALIMNGGFQANATVLSALLSGVLHGTLRSGQGINTPRVQLFCDRLNHASLHFGLSAAWAQQKRFRHNELEHLESLLRASRDQDGVRIIVTESVFSMDGDRLDVAALRFLGQKYGAFLVIDEAHATGVLGRKGMGLCALDPDQGPLRENELVIGTFSKALGSFGAYVACSLVLRDYLINHCSGYIYSTALPPQILGAMDAALQIVPSMEAERQHLQRLAQFLRDGLRDLSLETGPSTTQIVPAFVGDIAKTMTLKQHLDNRGFVVGGIRPPAVPQGSARLRITPTAHHSIEDIKVLLNALEEGL